MSRVLIFGVRYISLKWVSHSHSFSASFQEFLLLGLKFWESNKCIQPRTNYVETTGKEFVIASTWKWVWDFEGTNFKITLAVERREFKVFTFLEKGSFNSCVFRFSIRRKWLISINRWSLVMILDKLLRRFSVRLSTKILRKWPPRTIICVWKPNLLGLGLNELRLS